MSREFYEQIRALHPDKESMTVTVVSGEFLGEKAILSEGRLIWTSQTDGFFSRHADAAAQMQESGIQELDGVKLYTERIGHGKKLVICGGGHVSIAIIRMAKLLGMEVTVLEDRPNFADNAKNAGADIVICDAFEEGLQQITGDLDTYFVIVTRGHQWDTECLRAICRKSHAYIGMMGSRRRVRIVKEGLVEEGIARKIIDAVHSPIGLEIGSETPEEIAVSILAEIISVKNQKKDFAYPGDIMEAILGGHHTDPLSGSMIMATIIARKGSAPREVGTKMLILSDGRCINTIGGGCVEASVIQTAKEMLLTKGKPQVIRADLTAEEASLEGEVCGGILDVLMEEIS